MLCINRLCRCFVSVKIICWQAWEKDLQHNLTNEDWDVINEYANKGFLNVAIQENCYKIKICWYRTPALLCKFSPPIPSMCWRCSSDLGTMLHVWLACENLHPFWWLIHDIIAQVTAYTLNFTPLQYLLHHTSLSKAAYRRSLALHLVNAARLSILVHWRSTRTLLIEDWFVRINKIEERSWSICLRIDCMNLQYKNYLQ